MEKLQLPVLEQPPPPRSPRWRRVLAAIIAGALVFWYGFTRRTPYDPVEEVLRLAPLTDGHNDFPIFIRAYYHNHIYRSNFSDTISLPGQVDFPRLREGRLRGQFWSVYVPCDNENPSDDKNVHITLQQIDLVHRLASLYPNHLALVPNTRTFLHTFHTTNLISSFMGVEGLHQVGSSAPASTLRLYHRLGVRYTTLTHTCHNPYADSASPSTPLHGGLSPAGRDMVTEMNRLGMAVDLAHVSVDTMNDALDVSRAPVMFSHSSAKGICGHERNVPDGVLERIKEKGGVVMVTFFPEYTLCPPSPGSSAIPSSSSSSASSASSAGSSSDITGYVGGEESVRKARLSDVADHIQYIGDLIGYAHVGLGSDFDGMENTVEGLEDVSKYPDLIRELLDRGISVKDVAGVIGGNVLRVMDGVERVAREMEREGVRPLEDEVMDLF